MTLLEPTREPLLPDRYPIQDFFLCDVTDAIPKDDLGSMEHPIFSLATKPDTRPREYKHQDVFIKVTPSSEGLATIHDKDILIYCISQLMAKINQGQTPHKVLLLKAYDLLVATNRRTDGIAYNRLVNAFNRLRGTTITTNLKTNNELITEGFGLIDSWRIIRNSETGRMVEVKVTLSDWVFNAITAQEVLTLNRDYFRLRKPLERRMYELARKHCGRKESWCISLETLRRKCGSTSSAKEFKRLVVNICNQDQQHQHMPDYAVALEGQNVRFTNRNRERLQPKLAPEQKRKPILHIDTYEKAKRAAPGADIYALEKEWLRFWRERGEQELDNPDGAFIAFCKKRWASQGYG